MIIYLICYVSASACRESFNSIMATKKDDILIINRTSKGKDYPNEAYELLFKIESRHFWFWGRNQIIKVCIEKMLNKTKGVEFLEVGCGTGLVLSSLEKMGLVATGVDLHLEGLKLARKRTKATLICGELKNINFKTKFDALGLFDVLEHVGNQKSLLKNCNNLLKPGGFIFLTVPAKMRLWSMVDEVSGHKRRYEKEEIIKVLSSAGYDVKKVNYFNFFLFLPQLIFRKYQDRKLTQIKNNHLLLLKLGLNPPNVFLNHFFKLLLFVESKLINFISFPFGASLIIVARKI